MELSKESLEKLIGNNVDVIRISLISGFMHSVDYTRLNDLGIKRFDSLIRYVSLQNDFDSLYDLLKYNRAIVDVFRLQTTEFGNNTTDPTIRDTSKHVLDVDEEEIDLIPNGSKLLKYLAKSRNLSLRFDED